MIIVERFKDAREQAGLTQSDLAKRVGVSQQAIGEIERGAVHSSKAIYKIAAVLGVPASYLDPSIPSTPVGARLVPIVGLVGAGTIYTIDDHAKGAGLDEIEAPPGVNSSSVVALRVRGDSMLPVYRDGDIIFYDQQETGDLSHLYGRDCVVHLVDGRTFLKEIRAINGDIYLHGHNAEPIFNPKISWAARVRWIERS